MRKILFSFYQCSEHRGEKGSGEIGGVYLPTQLERTHHNFARNGRQSERWRAMECTQESGHCQSSCTLSSVVVNQFMC